MGAPQYEQAGADIGGTGTTNTIPRWTGPSTLGDSGLIDDGTQVYTTTRNIGIGTATASAPLTFGKAVFGSPSSEDFYRIKIQDVAGTAEDVGIGSPATGSLGFNWSSSGNLDFYQRNLSATPRMRIDSAGRFGLGAVPNTSWGAAGTVFEMANGAFVLNYATATQIIVGANMYYDGGMWRYKANGAASHHEQVSGTHKFLFAPSGTANAVLVPTLAWQINNSGHFLAGADNTYDIGASGATRPRIVYVGTGVVGGYLRAGAASAGVASTTTIGNGTSTTATAGAQTLPANPLGFIIAHVGTTEVRIPYYAV